MERLVTPFLPIPYSSLPSLPSPSKYHAKDVADAAYKREAKKEATAPTTSTPQRKVRIDKERANPLCYSLRAHRLMLRSLVASSPFVVA